MEVFFFSFLFFFKIRPVLAHNDLRLVCQITVQDNRPRGPGPCLIVTRVNSSRSTSSPRILSINITSQRGHHLAPIPNNSSH
ncbi:hypothetical protein F4810DRAFT_697488 [Camillea tinctor]|nr:hypothetical protein F4810DRAFT_697488 [Camillea tinctor]